MANTKLKEFRQLVLEKFDYKCAYCGIYLDGAFHLDHYIPKRRYTDTHKELVRMGIIEHKEKGKDNFENYMPSCISCNSSKSDLSIEEFRDRIYNRLVRLNNNSSEYIIAKRFGLVIEVQNEIIFHFENYTNNIKI
jgi:5-methylcytosine-specific restriction endonuclease McrA